MNLPFIQICEENQGNCAQRLGEILLDRKIITSDKLEIALKYQREHGGLLGDILVKKKFLSSEDLAFALSVQMNVPVVDLNKIDIDQEAINLIPESIARKSLIMPLIYENDTLAIAMVYPDDINTIRDITAKTGKRIQVALARKSDIENTIDLYYRAQREIEKNLDLLAPTKVVTDPSEVELIAQTPVAQTLELIIKQAIIDRASDIHIEPQDKRVRIRYRIDGILHDMYSLPVNAQLSLISRIKILSQMNIAEQRRSQDGQFTMKIDNKEIDIRSSTMLTAYGERVSLRILDKSLSLISLNELGIAADQIDKYRTVLKNPFGIILVGGPTGSGKTTTLYAFINQFNRIERNIITIEDPIEYKFIDINQTQVNSKADLTFASGLRTILRHDPDVVLVGEIRDKETASIATQAALTGRLVLASIHANDAVSIIFRLVDLGIEPYLIATTLVAAISQRMVRRICPYCKVEYQPTPEEIALYKKETGDLPCKLYIGSGCKMCANTGFRGRIPIFELIQMNDRVSQLFLDGAKSAEIKSAAVSEGIVTMSKDGFHKVKEGLTSINEVIKNSYTSEYYG